jgi:squalene-hopene/tetraprenyl-beta-curcumene cyclase
LPVVSYALPALIAIGQVRHHHRPTRNPVFRWLRRATWLRTTRLLHEIQPASGGFLEATPLTSFVTMSLIGAGQARSPVVESGLRFLERSARPDGCWPIDTNLATWVTTLAVNALGDALPAEEREPVRDWLLNQQYQVEHPYTHAAPGGWAWTDLPGGVPDADDTPGALLALAKLGPPDERTLTAARAGVQWLLNLQNADGGIPTFCRGWTGLPFDRSSNDLTAHALLAWAAWLPHLGVELRGAVEVAARRGIRYLQRTQRPDGAWAPLWFGNQHADQIENLTYGTSRVLRLAAVSDALKLDKSWRANLDRAKGWLLAAQNPDGGWGGRPGTPSSIEETALALEGLAAAGADAAARDRGLRWLADATADGTRFPPTPIGFYFANLWYYEALYPLVYTVAALSKPSGDAAGVPAKR